VSLFFRVERIGWWWTMALPHIARVLKRGQGSYQPEDVKARCEAGVFQLWLCFEGNCIAAVITEIAQYPRKKTCIVRMIGSTGLPMDWHERLRQIEFWAEDQGCSAMEVFGRAGWKRRLPGYEFQQIVLRKEL
jgi:hypothetical protein